MGSVVAFNRAKATSAPHAEDAEARLARKLRLIRSDVRPEVTRALEDVVDYCLQKQAAGITGRR